MGTPCEQTHYLPVVSIFSTARRTAGILEHLNFFGKVSKFLAFQWPSIRSIVYIFLSTGKTESFAIFFTKLLHLKI